MEISYLISLALARNASDLHLSSGLAPIIRIDGKLEKLDLPILENDVLSPLMDGLMTSKQRQILQDELELDFAVQYESCRLRINIFKQARGISAAFRIIPNHIKTLDELALPPIFKDIALYTQGLVLLTGTTGSGKSTTLAALIAFINKYQYKHIITLEDPVEFIYESANSLIQQREINRDTHSFNKALNSVLREDPDIILVGELRDYQTIRLALTAAETGHLVFATLHTNSAATTVNRIIDVFPGDERSMIRSMLSESLKAVIAQTLVPKATGGRIAAFEIMIVNPAIKNLIREDKISQIYSTMQIGKKTGMQTFEQDLSKLYELQLISGEKLAKIPSIHSD
ncbi:MAG: type IV pilus twitching motility protein PilT [Tatlockia sp.]|nr:type IV pilus twitching motility protein PilT [Tatlockia sp.]